MMKKNIYDIVICGAGIAGISSAYYLSKNHNIHNILIVDERPPLSLTSDKSTECYRNWWPGPGDAMVKFMNRSIDLLEGLADESGNIFNLNRRGYLYATGDNKRMEDFLKAACEPSLLGAGPLRVYRNKPDDPKYIPVNTEGFHDAPDGADLFLDYSIIARYFPFLSSEVTAILHVRRAGWFSAQQLGMYLFNQIRIMGIHFDQTSVLGVNKYKNKVISVALGNGEVIQTGQFINAAGPFLAHVGNMLDVELPVFCELHQKTAFRDYLKAIPRDAPLLIWNDPQRLEWTEEEQFILDEQQDTRWMLGEFPPGAHIRPEGGNDSQTVIMLWEYDNQIVEPVWPPQLDPVYPEMTLKGLLKMLPKFEGYARKLPKFFQDGGYYTKTKENRPLICPLPVNGSYVIGALSGYGLMSACAAGELLAAHVAKCTLPDYASAFSLERYSNPSYLSLIDRWGDTGQL